MGDITVARLVLLVLLPDVHWRRRHELPTHGMDPLRWLESPRPGADEDPAGAFGSHREAVACLKAHLLWRDDEATERELEKAGTCLR